MNWPQGPVPMMLPERFHQVLPLVQEAVLIVPVLQPVLIVPVREAAEEVVVPKPAQDQARGTP